MQKALVVLSSICLLVIVLELGLRIFTGLGEPVLYVENDAYEYIAAPNQDTTVLGNRVIINEYSMRSAPLQPGACPIVLFMGDSVINGGMLTDHSDLATTLLEVRLQQRMGLPVRVLNVSAGSWGPDNAAAYLEQTGHFGARMLVLVFSSHDAGDVMTFEPTIGIRPGYPKHNPPILLVDVFQQSVLPWFSKQFRPNSDPVASTPDTPIFNPGWSKLIDYAERHDLAIAVYLHADRAEVDQGAYDERGQRILAFLRSNDVMFWQGIEILTNDAHFRDSIHISAAGQAVLADHLYPFLEEQVALLSGECR